MDFKLLETFIDRHFTNLTNHIDGFFRDIQITFLTYKIDDSCRNRMGCIFGYNLLCLHDIGNKQAQGSEFLIDG